QQEHRFRWRVIGFEDCFHRCALAQFGGAIGSLGLTILAAGFQDESTGIVDVGFPALAEIVIGGAPSRQAAGPRLLNSSETPTQIAFGLRNVRHLDENADDLTVGCKLQALGTLPARHLARQAAQNPQGPLRLPRPPTLYRGKVTP